MKKSKKFVLAGLALLAAITMVLLPLAGCKNDSVPPEVEKQEQGDGGGSETDKNNTVPGDGGGSETDKNNTVPGDGGSSETDKNNTAAKLVSITVTSPTRTVYSVGQSFDPTGMVVTATYNDGESKDVTDLATTDFGTVAAEKGLAKTVTVSYTEGEITRTTTFTVDVASYQFTETVQDVDSSYTGTMTDGTYKKFGDWPQTIKEEGVEIGAGTLVRGGLTYHVGSDGNYYVKAEEKANGTGTEYQYSNGEQAGQDGTSTKWFKVEPIVWRVLTKSTGNALLLAEKILTGGICYYVDSNQRTIGGKTVYPNNWQYSTIRAWLNGSYEANDTQNKTYDGIGFLQTAFTQSARDKIADTTVDNSAASTNPASNPKQWNSGTNLYASDTPTTDKIFLLSEAEATTREYDFDEYNRYVDYGYGTTTSTRIRVTTDYAKATGAYQGDSSAGYGGWWWLRSPRYISVSYAHVIDRYGFANYFNDVSLTYGGVVPALSISLK